MKRLLLFLTLTSLISCNNIVENKKIETVVKIDTVNEEISQKSDTSNKFKITETTSNRYNSLNREFKNYKTYSLADTIKADLNGDKILELAYFANKDNKKILVIDGQTKVTTEVGLDKSFGKIGSNFNWVDYWGTLSDNETFEVIVNDSGEIIGEKKVTIENTSLFVRKDEVGGGVITFKKGSYIWVHQAD